MSVIIILSTTGNILVVVAVFKDHRLRKIGNLFIVSLAFADLLVSIAVMTFAVVNDVMDHWYFGQEMCNLWISSDIMCSTASILNLCAISFDRYVNIKLPFRYASIVTKKRAFGAIGTIWLISALISFIPISYLSRHSEGTCYLKLTPVYAVVSSLISFYLPCLLMFILYIRLYKCAQGHVKKIKQQTAPIQLGTVNGVRLPPVPVCPVSENKAAVTVGVVVGIFALCWMPFFCVNIIAAFCEPCISPLLFKVSLPPFQCQSTKQLLQMVL